MSSAAASVFGSLDATGLSAAGDIALAGESADTTPPDTTGAIGPNQYVEFVNNEVVAYTRVGLVQVGTPASLTNFVGDPHEKASVCDPQIKYDPQTSRWFYVAIECNGTKTENALFMGFSKTSDPTDFSTATGHGWCGYSYPFLANFEDYPKLGLDALHIIIGTNSFVEAAGKDEFTTAHIFSLPKPAAGPIAACPSTPALSTFGSPLTTSVGNMAFTPEPATVADSSPNGFVVSADVAGVGNGKNIMIWQLAGSASAPELKPLGAPSVPKFTLPPGIPQPGSGDEIDSSDSRLTQAVAAADPNAGGAEAVWTQHTVSGGSGSVVRWYELVPSTLTVRQSGTISDPSNYVFNGAIAPTLAGGAVIIYNTGSASHMVELDAQSRVASASAGTMNTPVALGSSVAIDSDFSCPSQPFGKAAGATDCRWGDYAGASVDPLNGSVVWGSGQVDGATGASSEAGHAAQWETRNFALTANDVPPSASFTISPNPAIPGSSIGFDGSASSDADGSIASFSWNFGDGNVAGGATTSHTYSAVGTYAVTLTVSDNGAQSGAIVHSVIVNAAPATVSTSNTPALNPTLEPAPSSNFSSSSPTMNSATGAITLTVSVSDPGTLSWLLTFQNGRFGVFAAQIGKCKKGFVRLNRRCRPSKIVFGRGSEGVAAPGSVTFTVRPSGSALKALKSAARQKRGLPVSVTLTFQSARGASAVTRTESITVRLKKK